MTLLVASRISVGADLLSTRHSVENYPRDVQIGIKRLKSTNYGRRTPCHWMRINNKDDREIKPLGHFGRASCLGFSIKAVKQTHYTFDHCHIFTRTCTREQPLVRLTSEHPTVEVVRRNACGKFVQTGIDEIR